MNLKRMLLLASMSLAAVAFAVPAAAQAQTHGLTENGVFIGAGAQVRVTSTNLQTVTPLGTLTCGKVTLHYEVETNTDEHVALNPIKEEAGKVVTAPTENATTENCKLNGTTAVDIAPAGTHTVTINTWGFAEAESSFTGKITFSSGPVTCTFSGKVKLQAKNASSEITIGKSTLAGGLCGNGEMSGTGTTETPNGTALTADIKTT